MQDNTVKEIVIFMIGGTIAMRSSPLGAVPSDDLADSLKEALATANVSIRLINWSSKPSPHVTPEDMLALSQDIEKELAKSTVHGAIVLHGTDLLAETAFVLDRALISPKPVVCSGSMRHMEENGYDGIRNVVNSVVACLAMPSSSEVLVQMADCLYTATDTVKFDSLSVASMKGMVRGVIGRVVDGQAFFTQAITVERPRLPFAVKGIGSRVPLISCYPGIATDDIFWPCQLVAALTANISSQAGGGIIASGISPSVTASQTATLPVSASPIVASCALPSGVLPDGIVLEGFGAGNVPPGILDFIDLLLAHTVPIVLTSRSPLGGVMPLYGYEGGGGQLLNKGVISAKTLSAVKAQLLLKMALASGCPKNAVKEIFANV